MDGIEKGFALLIVAVFAVILINILLNVNYQSTTQGTINLKAQFPALITTQVNTGAVGLNALYTQNQVFANSLILGCSGSCGWFYGNTTTLYVYGNAISAYANTLGLIYAVGGNGENQSFSITNGIFPQVLGTNAGNYYTLNALTYSVAGHTNAASPSFTLTVTQSFNAVVHGTANAFTTNTIAATLAFTFNPSGSVANYSAAAGGITQVLGNNMLYVVGILILIVVIIVLITAIRSGKLQDIMGGSSG